jgi:uncharacterized protein YndB with AHSA1/START domain
LTERPGRVVRIERNFDAPAEAVFDAWTSPDVMRRWFHVEADWVTPEAEVDVRPGGRFRVLMRRPDGTEHVIEGAFTEVDRPHRLALSCTFSDDPTNEQRIELSFSESDGSTTVLLVNSGIAKDERRDAQDYGWQGCFDQLERALAR